jgi:hypothetical protein
MRAPGTKDCSPPSRVDCKLGMDPAASLKNLIVEGEETLTGGITKTSRN